jgi:hypothetical protein
MNEPNNPFDDPLTAVSNAVEHPMANDALRKILLAQTVGVLRRRRRLKRCAVFAGLMACYLAGLATMGVLRAVPQQPAPVGQPAIVDSHPALPRRPQRSPRQDGHQVAVKKPSAYENWRQIGDSCLSQSGDVSQAVAGYRKAINRASKEERGISPGPDNWLMMALKEDARLKEKTHVYSEHN